MIDTDTRTTGVKLRLLDLSRPLAAVTELIREAGDETGTAELGFAPYAMAEHGGKVYVICSEGVGWEVSDDRPLELDIYVSHPGTMAVLPNYSTSIGPQGVRELATGTHVDLADHIRRFGSRLESNFWAWHRTLTTGVTRETWTFCGHWENGEIVVDFVMPGEVQDTREDTGQWDEGLWAASGTGYDLDATQAAVIAEYVTKEA